MEHQEPFGEEEEMALARAEETEQYASTMRRYLDELTQHYELMMNNLIAGKGSEEYINACIAKMLSVFIHLYPKIEGGGDKTDSIKEEFKKYDEWTTKVQIMKVSKAEMDKIPGLYRLIVKAYDVLGISSI